MPNPELSNNPEPKWKNQGEYNAVMVQYLMEAMEEFAESQPGIITEEQIDELSSPECEKAVKNLQGVQYITEWVQRHQIPVNVEEIILVGERNFERLLQNYNEEFGPREE